MRILNVMQCTNLGGMEQASLRLMAALQQRGHSFEVLSLNPVGALGPLLARQGIPAVGAAYRGPGGLYSHRRVRQEIRERRGDAVLMTGHHLLTTTALPRNNRARQVLAVHHYHEGVKPDWLWRLFYRIAYANFSAIVFPSDFLRREAEVIGPLVARISHTIRNPLPLPALPTDSERFEARRSLGLAPDRPVVGNAGWLSERKRLDVFLRVAREVSQANGLVQFVIAGDGPVRSKMQQLASELGIAPQVKWLSWLVDTDKFYRSLDVLLFNSDSEAFPTTPLEALGYGVPVVASLIRGGLAEAMCGDLAQWLSDRHDVPSLASKLVSLLENPEVGKVTGMLGRERVGNLCDVKTASGAYEALLCVGGAQCGGTSE